MNNPILVCYTVKRMICLNTKSSSDDIEQVIIWGASSIRNTLARKYYTITAAHAGGGRVLRWRYTFFLAIFFL